MRRTCRPVSSPSARRTGWVGDISSSRRFAISSAGTLYTPADETKEIPASIRPPSAHPQHDDGRSMRGHQLGQQRRQTANRVIIGSVVRPSSTGVWAAIRVPARALGRVSASAGPQRMRAWRRVCDTNCSPASSSQFPPHPRSGSACPRRRCPRRSLLQYFELFRRSSRLWRLGLSINPRLMVQFGDIRTSKWG